MKSKTTTFENDLKDITESRFFSLRKQYVRICSKPQVLVLFSFFYLQDYKKPSINASKPRVNQVKNKIKKIKKPRELDWEKKPTLLNSKTNLSKVTWNCSNCREIGCAEVIHVCLWWLQKMHLFTDYLSPIDIKIFLCFWVQVFYGLNG